MIPSMHERVKDFFVEAGLADGFIVQMLRWEDNKNRKDRFLVFRPGGGTAIKNDLGSYYYIGVEVIGAVGDDRETDKLTHSIIDYIQKNPMSSDCIGYIENMGGIPQPIVTAENRLVYRLRFSVTYGE